MRKMGVSIYTIKHMDGSTKYAREVEILGPSKMVYDGKQLSWCPCLDRNVFELSLVDEMTYQEAKDAIS